MPASSDVDARAGPAGHAPHAAGDDAAPLFASPMLSGRYVRLEPLTLDHVPALCAVGLEPEIWRWTTSAIQSEEDMLQYVQHALEARAAGTALPFATVQIATGRVVGSTRFGNIDSQNRRVEIGWTWVATPWQRTAVNTEAKLLMLEYAFGRMGCVRVELKTDALNQRSRDAISRLGAREEGTLRSHMVAQGGRLRDTVYFSILRNEWPDVRGRLQQRLDDHDTRAGSGDAGA